jgi:hypothetical protein
MGRQISGAADAKIRLKDRNNFPFAQRVITQGYQVYSCLGECPELRGDKAGTCRGILGINHDGIELKGRAQRLGPGSHEIDCCPPNHITQE